MMKIYPIDHSGFMVELEKHLLLFDYDKKDLPITKSNKPLYVFVSHNHQDHYNPETFEKTQDFQKENSSLQAMSNQNMNKFISCIMMKHTFWMI